MREEVLCLITYQDNFQAFGMLHAIIYDARARAAAGIGYNNTFN